MVDFIEKLIVAALRRAWLVPQGAERAAQARRAYTWWVRVQTQRTVAQLKLQKGRPLSAAERAVLGAPKGSTWR